MDYHMLAGPVIGAVIGYCTNYVAVKMLFRPLHSIKLGAWTLPFTPGIIPRGKPRLAKAIGNAVGTNLLTEDSFTGTLLSPAIEKHLKEKVRLFLYENRKNESTLRELILQYLEEPLYEAGVGNMKTMVTDKLVTKILEMDMGTMIANEVVKAVREKLRGGLLSLMMTDGLIDSLRISVAEEINRYLREHADELVAPKIEEECLAAMDTKVGSLVSKIDDCGLPFDEILWNAYTALVDKKLGSALKRLDISGMIEKKINEMDVMEMETLVLAVMKKELNAVVNLGAVIGFVLGLFHLLAG